MIGLILFAAATLFTISPFLTTLIVGHILPLLTALATKVEASATVKQLVTAVLSAASAFIVNATTIDGSATFSGETVAIAILTFLTANVSYVALWKRHAIDSKVLPDKGLGG